MSPKPFRRNVRLGLLLLVGALALSATPAWAATPRPHATRTRQSDIWSCMQVTAGVPLNVRAGPGTRYGVLRVLTPGVRVEAATERTVQAEGYTWVPIRLPDGRGGWSVIQRFAFCDPPPTQENATELLGAELGTAVDGGVLSVLATVNQDGTLDHDEIAAIAQAVVLLEIEGGWGWATGTGTLISPNGVIVTNAHVVEDADTITVYVLEDINAQPVPRYQGSVLLQDDRLDVAVVGITADRYGDPLAPEVLKLPYLPLEGAPQEMYRGDEIYIFGYPGIGDTYLVLTRGGIVSVEGGTLAGVRMPLWYRTDAEIAPGNSGGLVVDGNGRFVGIPTFVESEDVTGGRLGGIRAAPVVLHVLAQGGFVVVD